MSDPLLTVSDLTVEMPGQPDAVVVVKDVNLQLDRGETLALVGESGCGKTTTLLSILRLLPRGARITGGEIRFEGRELTALSEQQLRAVRGGHIGVVWQDPLAALDPVMRVGPQIAETVRAHTGADRAASDRRAMDLMRLVELPDVERTFRAYPHELSGGQRQRVVIAAAVAADPAVLLADEPTTALDVTVQDQVLALLARLRDQLGLALLLVTHDLAVVGETCDRVAIMYAGRIVETGPTAEVFTGARHPYSAGLLRAAPDVDRPGHRPVGIPGAPPAGVAEGFCAFASRCARADEVCRTTLPLLGTATAITAHRAACHHPLTGSPAGALGIEAPRNG